MKPLYLIFAFFVSIASTANAQSLTSPNKKIKVVLEARKKSEKDVYGKICYKLQYANHSDDVEVLSNSSLGIIRSDQVFTDNLRIVGESNEKAIHEKYTLLSGKRKICENFGTEKTFYCINSNNQAINIVFRAYNDGVAFRYEFTQQSDSTMLISDETTTYVLPDSANRWMQPYNTAYEDFYFFSKTGLSEVNKKEWSFPALFKLSKQPIWLLISEANNSKYNCASRLTNYSNANEYKVTYPGSRDNFKQVGVKTALPWTSQWHTLQIGKLSDIVTSTLITDVSKSNQVKTTDWIKSGAVSWIYWANNHGSKDYKKVVEYADLASNMKWPYLLIDWEWDVMSNGGTIIEAVNYAKSKGVKSLMWYNSGTSWLEPTPNDRLLTKEKRAKEFLWLNKIGVSGIKVDFFAGDQQDMMKFYIDILEEAAQYNLMVNFHGATIPRGWSRTYPNLMTTEAVYGAEWYNNLPVLTNKAAVHNTTLPFTRNVIGSMDYTPVTFSNTQHPHITSYGHELALSVVFESGLQHFADCPKAYDSLPSFAKAFLSNMPASWDDTKLIDGFPGDFIIIARKKGTRWYVGGLNGKDEPRNLTLTFDFLGSGTYDLKLIKDGKDDKSFATENKVVKRNAVVQLNCLSRGGFVGVIDTNSQLKRLK